MSEKLLKYIEEEQKLLENQITNLYELWELISAINTKDIEDFVSSEITKCKDMQERNKIRIEQIIN